MLTRLVLAALLGSLIGLEREFHGRPAGLRTHMLVCLGAAMITVSGMGIAGAFEAAGSEVGRIVAGVVTGIGFLGAGAIVRTSDFVRGLTTAACIWFVAALGVVTGLGEYELAFMGTGIALMIVAVLPVFEDRLADLKYRDVLVTGENREPEILLEHCMTVFKEYEVTVHDMDMEIDREKGSIAFLFRLRLRRLEDKLELLNRISGVDGVTGVQWKRAPGKL